MSKTVGTKTGYQAEAIKVRGGGDYVTVAERIQEAHHTDFAPRFEVIESKPLSLGNVHLWQVSILCEGKRFTATASINFGGKGADSTNPVENAETSALGRALGFAGFGSIGSIASADEVYTARSRESSGYVAQAPTSKPATENQKEEIQFLANELGLDGALVKNELKAMKISWKAMTHDQANKYLGNLGVRLQETKAKETANV